MRMWSSLGTVPPTWGAVVMGTGIVSIGLTLDHRDAGSRILLAIAAAMWFGLALGLAIKALYDRDQMRAEARTPAALTGVAGAAALGARLAIPGFNGIAAGLLVIALLLWLALLEPVARNWKTPTTGVSLMATVSTESLAVLAATVAVNRHASWLLYASLVPFLVGLALYMFVIAQFDFRELMVGRGDHWITGGAMAISSLAAARITLSATTLHVMTAVHGALTTASVVLWAITIAWLPVLLAAEALRPRLDYDLLRWSTVFPVGMYAVCSFTVGTAASAPGISDFAKIWLWVSLAVWLFVFVPTLGRIGRGP